MPWAPPQEYKPDPNLDEKLRHDGPPVGTPLFDMVLFRQWTRYWWQNKSVEQAWADLHMSPANARKAIDLQIVSGEIYQRVLERAQLQA